jgi:ferredoxin-NADP reductase
VPWLEEEMQVADAAHEYTVAFREHIPCGESVGTFRFDKPDGYEFSAGEFFSLALETREGTPGTEVHIAGPRGRLKLDESVRRVAFLVGGIGVTPARSIVRDAVQRRSGLEIALFYGNQDERCIPFREEFAGYEREHPEIRVIDVLFDPPEGWPGETGFITAEVVRRHVDALDGWHWVVAGPPPMIEPMKAVLAELAIPAERVSLESFAGYS